jgi:hypothetical protein
MAFNYTDDEFVSFAEYADVVQRDARLFESNEVINSAETIDELMAQASQRILTQLRNTGWWKQYQFDRDASLQRNLRLLPSINPDNIQSREQEFKDLNIYFAMAEYILPLCADFGNETSAEVVKIAHYRDQYTNLFNEIVEAGDWYDFDADGTVETAEKAPSLVNRTRVR